MIAIPNDFGARLHGAAVHFPLAMVSVACVCDLLAVVFWNRPLGRHASAAGRLTIVVGALGGVAAVATGLWIARGQLWGSGSLLWHHRFVWPAFVLMMAAAIWRSALGDRLTRRQHIVYLGAAMVTTGLTMAAGYWGGEMLLGPG